jgi:hypothetical protein
MPKGMAYKDLLLLFLSHSCCCICRKPAATTLQLVPLLLFGTARTCVCLPGCFELLSLQLALVGWVLLLQLGAAGLPQLSPPRPRTSRNSITPSRAFLTSGVSVLIFMPGPAGMAQEATGLGLFSTCNTTAFPLT